VRNCGAKHPHRNCGVSFRTQCHARPQTQRAVQRRTQLAAERVSQAGTRCATRRAVHRQVEKGVDVLTDSGAELPSLGAIGRRAETRTRRAANQRAKSLIDGHIDGRIVLRVEPRSHPRIDPPIAGSGAGQDRCPWFAPAFRLKRGGGLSPVPACLLYPAYLMPHLVTTTLRTTRGLRLVACGSSRTKYTPGARCRTSTSWKCRCRPSRT